MPHPAFTFYHLQPISLSLPFFSPCNEEEHKKNLPHSPYSTAHMNSPAFSSAVTLTIIFTLTTISFPQKVTSLGSSATIAVSYAPDSTYTVCGIIASKLTQAIQCYKDGQIISIQPEISYESISGGLGRFCGLQAGGFSIICWETTSFRAKRIYYSNDNPMKSLTVGKYQVCALQATSGVASCWRFPSPEVGWKFRTITSGGGFSCGIMKNASRVHCWGGSDIGAEIERQFDSLPMLSFVAGESHACGMTKTGILICKGSNNGGQLNVPSQYGFEFSSLALGANHSCGIRRKNGLVVCWGGGSRKSEFSSNVVDDVSFEQIVAGLDFTCGLTTKDLSIICWGPGWSGDLTVDVVPLKPVIPGPCVQMSCSICGVYPNSGSLCAGSGSICKLCEVEFPIPVILPPIMPSPSLQVPGLASSPSSVRNKIFLAFGIVGFIGTSAGICIIAYCIWSGFCSNVHKKVYKSMVLQPSRARSNLEDYLATSNASILPPSGSSPIQHNYSWIFRRQKSGTSSRQTETTENFTLSELAAITNNFALENKIGGGSFGGVYKGKLADGREVAIKRGDITSKTKKFQENESSYVSEIALLSCLNHKHLVGLVGFCQENDERLLVYEYMRNGSLHDHLHTHDQGNTCSSMLNSWRIRIRIALDAARGIEYLHDYSIPPIIHRDIKSSNILLDENLIARVSDFGLSLICPESEDEPMYTNAVGTVGYIDPEYYVLNILTVKSDVYGFGVVLLELLTGKKAVFKNEGAGRPMGVVEYARPWILAGELEKILDKRVGLPEMNEIKAVENVAQTALDCINLQGKDRPTMSDVAANLEKALALCEESPAIVLASPA